MRIGYNTWSMATVPYQTFIPALADIGFGAIALSVVPGYTIGGQWVNNAAALDRLSADERRRIAAALIERDLKLPSVIGNQSLVDEDAVRNAEAMQRLRDSIDLCVELALGGEVPTLNTGIGGHSGELRRIMRASWPRLRGPASAAGSPRPCSLAPMSQRSRRWRAASSTDVYCGRRA